METKTVVLEIPEEILERGEKIAAEQHVSLSGLVTKLLREVRIENHIDSRVDDPAYQAARKLYRESTEKGFPITSDGVIDWKREDLYDRHGSE